MRERPGLNEQQKESTEPSPRRGFRGSAGRLAVRLFYGGMSSREEEALDSQIAANKALVARYQQKVDAAGGIDAYVDQQAAAVRSKIQATGTYRGHEVSLGDPIDFSRFKKEPSAPEYAGEPVGTTLDVGVTGHNEHDEPIYRDLAVGDPIAGRRTYVGQGTSHRTGKVQPLFTWQTNIGLLEQIDVPATRSQAPRWFASTGGIATHIVSTDHIGEVTNIVELPDEVLQAQFDGVAQLEPKIALLPQSSE